MLALQAFGGGSVNRSEGYWPYKLLCVLAAEVTSRSMLSLPPLDHYLYKFMATIPIGDARFIEQGCREAATLSTIQGQYYATTYWLRFFP